MAQPVEGPRRARLNRDRVLRAAVALADEAGIEALSMRKLAEELGVVPMALYKHVAGKEELLDGMVDIVIGEVGPPAGGAAGRARSGSGSSRPGARCSATPGRPGPSSRERIRRRRYWPISTR